MLRSQRHQLMLVPAETARLQRFPLAVDVLAVTADRGHRVVDGGRQTRERRVHQGVEQVVVIVLDVANVGHGREGVADDGLQALVGGAQLHATDDPQGQE